MKTDAENKAKVFLKNRFTDRHTEANAFYEGYQIVDLMTDFHAKMLEEKMPSEREIKEIITKVVDNEKHLTLYGKVTMISEILIQHLKKD